MDQYFDNFLSFKGFGPGIEPQDVPTRTLSKYRGRLPDKLLEYWQTYGWRGWANGLFWTVDPEPWAPVVDAWLQDTPFDTKDTYHLIARSAFGQLFLWGEVSGPSLVIQASYATLFPIDVSGKLARDGVDKQVQLFFSTQSQARHDLQDENGLPMFTRVLERLGPLDHVSMYGFVPALALGGPAHVDHLQKLDAVTHLMILAQIGPKRIMQDIGKLIRE